MKTTYLTCSQTGSKHLTSRAFRLQIAFQNQNNSVLSLKQEKCWKYKELLYLEHFYINIYISTYRGTFKSLLTIYNIFFCKISALVWSLLPSAFIKKKPKLFQSLNFYSLSKERNLSSRNFPSRTGVKKRI